MAMNTHFFATNRGIIKIAQIIIGFVITSLLCTAWYGGRSCIQEGRLGYTSGLNSVCIIINIVLLVLNFCNLAAWGLEKIYSIIAAVLFLIAACLLIWYLIQFSVGGQFYITTVLVIVMFCLYLWDVKILQGESPN